MALAHGIYFLSLLVHLIANPVPQAEHERDDKDIWQKVDDMILSPIQTEYLYSPFNIRRNAYVRETSRWPNGIVPIEFDPDYSEDQVALVINILNSVYKPTCIQFRARNETDRDYIRIVNGDNCSSFVGRVKNMQKLSLNKQNCLNQRTIAHEFTHALGLVHQQTASNRDDYITIDWDNIKPKHRINFKRYEHSTSYGQPYDFDSIMHYPDKAYSINGKPTVIAKQGNVRFGYATSLSKIDIFKINKMYNNCK